MVNFQVCFVQDKQSRIAVCRLKLKRKKKKSCDLMLVNESTLTYSITMLKDCILLNNASHLPHETGLFPYSLTGIAFPMYWEG